MTSMYINFVYMRAYQEIAPLVETTPDDIKNFCATQVVCVIFVPSHLVRDLYIEFVSECATQVCVIFDPSH